MTRRPAASSWLLILLAAPMLVPLLVFPGELSAKPIGEMVRLERAALLPKLESALMAHLDSAGRLRVQIEATGRDLSGIRTAVAAAGGTIERSYANLSIASMPSAALDALAGRSDVVFVQLPYRPVPDAIQGEEVTASGATAWHSDGTDGTGIKVAIMDNSFAGYQGSVAAGELPSSMRLIDFTGGKLLQGSGHGTAAAEVIHEMAPGALLYLIAVEDSVGLGQAKDYCVANGISIVSHSMSWFNTSRGDGGGGPATPDGIVADARAQGILWVNSAGNQARRHWGGTFGDANGNGVHEFVAGDPASEMNSFSLPGGGAASIYLKWDDWPVTTQNFDLHLYETASATLVAASETAQHNTPPTEVIHYTNSAPNAQSYYLQVRRVGGAGFPRLDLFVVGADLAFSSATGSLTEPASSGSTMAAGAVHWQTNALDPSSSRGPTIDGRTKPDIAGQSGISSATLPGGFAGTSAGAASVAGAAALVKQRFPSYGPVSIQDYLESAALDLGDTGKDSLYGSGVMSVPGADPSATTQSISLHAGWNWFSVSVQPSDPSLAAALSSISGLYDYVLSEAGTYAPPPADQAPNTLGSLEPGKGYMIRMKRAATLAVRGVRVSPSTAMDLASGWHWIGYLGTAPRSPAMALSSVDQRYDWLLGETGTYAPPPAPGYLNNLNIMEEGKGYLIRMTQPGTIVWEP